MIDLSADRGRWVATHDGRVIAAGATAVETYETALRRDAAERFYLQFVEEAGAPALPLPPLLEDIALLLEKETPLYIVGGTVRDALLGRSSHDVDLVLPRNALALTFRLADALHAPAYVLDAARETGRIVFDQAENTVDIAKYRGRGLLEDLRDRDFTINAIAMPVTARTAASLIDPTGGLEDLAAGLIRATSSQSLRKDPLRAMRAVRLAHQLDFTLTGETEQEVRATASQLPVSVSAERIRDELVRMVGLSRADLALEQMHDLGLLSALLPEIAELETVSQSPPHYEPVLDHTLSVLKWLERLEQALFSDVEPARPGVSTARTALADYLGPLQEHRARAVDGGLTGLLILRLAALFHDAGKRIPMSVGEDSRYRFYGHAEAGSEIAAHRLRELCFSNDALSQVQRIVAEHVRPLLLLQSHGGAPTRRAVYRYFSACGANGLDVGLLALADHLATYDGTGEMETWSELLDLVSTLFEYYFERHDEAVKPPALINGRELMQQLDLTPGPEVGRLLRLIEEGQAAGDITTVEQALRFAEDQHNRP